MLLLPYTCLLCLSTMGLWTVHSEEVSDSGSTRGPHRNIAPNNVDFAFSLYKHLVASSPGENVFLSPVSISMALALLSLGTRGNTRTQILQGLGFNLTEISEAEIHQGFRLLQNLLEESDTGLEMTMGNTLFLGHSPELLGLFSADIRQYYKLEAIRTDPQDWARASRLINDHIKYKTQGKIDLLMELDGPASPVLINYIFFAGTLAQPFHPASTKEEDFHVNEMSTVKVPMMLQSSPIKYLDDPVLPCLLVQLDYTGNGTAFLILPDEGKMDTVIAALSRDTIQRWSKSLRSSWVHLYIPRLSLSGVHDLGNIMADMGIADLLNNQTDFSGITQEPQLKVSKVVHKAGLQFAEEGVKDAAPTQVPKDIMAAEPLTVIFNRPFIIMIFDHFTWSSLLLGKVENPS
ncbi:PREDICTED: corticosteroid-binding globulin [Condylura cristata]|uniref:corticosteroid-binding globulin n=1 Tax=Condylura cristata TaxID=143302 RepID=UPI0003347AEE|nr:PREDICTED: corticosteroid-binding globulin [Condylura cristata]